MTEKSHVQLPRFIQRRFMNADGKVFYLNCDDFSIKTKGPRILGQITGYYSSEMEDYLDRDIEDPFSKLVARISYFAEGKQACVKLNSSDDVVCKRYIAAALMKKNGYVLSHPAGSENPRHLGYAKNGIKFELHHHCSQEDLNIVNIPFWKTMVNLTRNIHYIASESERGIRVR